ncbi:hypothetical protein [Pseudovibrio ascidiaceicola]|uniref:hypothetical protein n=1 Tax=Pseudovibrio ascidiaceicola TaxID=285279 RepID=UPI000D69F744|nr:hypothetical protein [Pseudovibrio ascidiaceicola]
MPFTAKQLTWLKTAQQGAGHFEQNSERVAAKAGRLNDIMTKLDGDKETIREAQNFEVTLARNEKWFKLPGSGTKMPWMTGDMQTEIDTRADIRADSGAINAETLKKLNASFERILARQAEMIAAKDKDGKEMFSEEDITRELWTPLVREGIIPSNLVPSRYSQFEKMFKGGAKIYEQKLEEHSETASKHENTLEAIGFARDVVTLATSIGSNAITLANLNTVAGDAPDKDQISAKQEVLNNQKGQVTGELRTSLGMDANASSEDVIKAAKDAGQYGDQLQKVTNIDSALNSLGDNLSKDANWVAEQRALFTATTTLLDTGLAAAEKGIVFSEQKGKTAADKLSFANEAGEMIGEEIKKVLSAGAAFDKSASDRKGDDDHGNIFEGVSGLIDVAMAGGRVSEKILQATQAPDKDAKQEAVMSIIGTLADSLSTAISSGSQLSGTESATPEIVGEALKAAMIATTDAGTATKALIDGDYQAFAEALTGGLANLASATGSDAIGDAITGKIQPDQGELTEEGEAETEGLTPQQILEKKLKLAGPSAGVQSVEKSMELLSDDDIMANVNALLTGGLDKLKKPGRDEKDAEIVKKNTAAALKKIEEEKTGNALASLKEKLADPKERKAYMDEIEKAADEEHKALQDLIAEASSPDDPNDEKAVEKSLKAIDTLLADIKASQMKIKMIETIASGGVKAVTTIFPATGLAEAIRKLTMDAIALAKKSAEVEKWRKNVNMAEASNSVYYHAIKERHTQAAIQVSQKTLNTFFSVVGVAAEIARLADATQASAGISAGMNMGRALSDFGYKTYGRAKIIYGWKKYQEARMDPANRKAARAAIAGNSTLAKCVLAYGIVEEKDPIARQVGRNSGLTPEVLVSSTDVCSAVVRYFETLYSDDPVVLRRVPKVENWHPCTPDLTLKSWFLFKKAATTRAYPRMARDSCLTPNIDRSIKELHKLCNGDPFKYPEVRDEQLSKPDGMKAVFDYATQVGTELDNLKKGLDAYAPVTDKPEDPKIEKWTAGQRHSEMEAVVDAMSAQIELVHREITADLKLYKV